MKNRLKQAEAVHKATIGSLSKLDIKVPLQKSINLISRSDGRILVTGVGKSVFIGKKFCATLTSLGIPAHFLHPTDALHGDSGAVKEEDVLVAFSFSGESKEVVDIVKYLSNNFGLEIISITTPGSTLSKASRVTLPVIIKDEGSPLNLAPMASTTVSLVVADMLAAALVDANRFSKEHFTRFHPGGALGLKAIPVRKVMSKGLAVPIVGESESFLQAVKVIDQKKKGVAAVVRKGVLKGVITDGDVRRVVIKNKDLSRLTAIEAMTGTPKTISPEASLHEALKEMEKYKITTLFAINQKNEPIGLIHMHDIINRSL
jgi:arabinose-5-phosphate isomerase